MEQVVLMNRVVGIFVFVGFLGFITYNSIERGNRVDKPVAPIVVTAVTKVPTYVVKKTNYVSSSYHKDLDLLADAMFFEARGEDTIGQTMVFDVIMNRVHSKHFGNSIRDVLYKPKAFSYLNTLSEARREALIKKNVIVYRKIRKLAHKLLSSRSYKDYTKGSIYYFNYKKAKPNWYSKQYVAAVYKNHVFLTNCKKKA